MNALAPEQAAVIKDAMARGENVVGVDAPLLETIDAAIDYLAGWRDYVRADLAWALSKKRQQSTTTIIPGYRIEARNRSAIVCRIHHVWPELCSCKNVERIEMQGPGLTLVSISRVKAKA